MKTTPENRINMKKEIIMVLRSQGSRGTQMTILTSMEMKMMGSIDI